MSDPAADIVEGLWARLRNALIALDRIDRLETASDFVGWVEAFQRDDAQIEATTRDWLLRALRLAADPLNYRLLSALGGSDGVILSELMRVTNTTRVDLSERVKDLAQMGLVTQALDADAVSGTHAAVGIVAWIESLQEQMAEHARAGLAKDNPPPRLHRPPA
ncbi:MAG: winged helix DNA-binding protein [Chloroflexi bacterium]|nr:winged helix DNA-binding protein [Chloroflexota bacterium]